MSAQELARKHPEFQPIYDWFHAYPRTATNRFVKQLPHYWASGTQRPYFKLPDRERAMIDELLIQQKVNRQGQPRMTRQQTQQLRGFTDEDGRCIQ